MRKVEKDIDFKLWDRKEERYLDCLERSRYFINCATNKVYRFDKRTYYGGSPFTDVTDRYEIRQKETHK